MASLQLSRHNDLTGQRFGKLVAVEAVEKSKNGTVKWRCKCDCGEDYIVFSTALRRTNGTRSCKVCNEVGKSGTHHMKNTPEYRSWRAMKARCDNPKATDFKHYGGRGITYCKRWEKFEAFYADMGPRPKDRTLDRIDVNGNYEPGNCRWATHHEQITNRRPIK